MLGLLEAIQWIKNSHMLPMVHVETDRFKLCMPSEQMLGIIMSLTRLLISGAAPMQVQDVILHRASHS
jgi:hypothetical protein